MTEIAPDQTWRDTDYRLDPRRPHRVRVKSVDQKRVCMAMLQGDSEHEIKDRTFTLWYFKKRYELIET